MLLEVIRKWLKRTLKISLTVTPTYFFEATKDGTLLAQILHHYGVISEEERNLIEESKDPVVMYENYSDYIRDWLLRIDFDLPENDIQEITYGDNSSAAALFYELYIKLDNRKERIHMPKQHGFKIEKVSQRASDVFEANPLCEPLIKQWDIINWERDHVAGLMLKYNRSREQYGEYLEKKKMLELRQVEEGEPLRDTLRFIDVDTDHTYEELVRQQRAAVALEPFAPSREEAKRIMGRIRERGKRRAERNAFRLQLQHELMEEVWTKIAEMEEDKFDKTVCEKLLRQSEHEKQIEEKLLEIRRQKDVMVENRKKQDEVDRKKREEEFVRRLFEDALEERVKFHEERMALISEHQKLYADHLRLKALKHEKITKEVMDDIVELALKTEEYKKMYGLEPDEYTLRQWATLFIKQQPIFEMVAPSEVKVPQPEDVTEQLEEIYRRELQRQDVLDDQDLDDYVHFRNVWTIEGDLEETTTMEFGMNCLGFAVHRLLLRLYPLPVPVKPELPETEVAVCANNVTDTTRIELLKRLMRLRDIAVVQMEDATDFCIKAYESELKTEYDDPFPEEEMNLKELSPKGKEKEQGKGKKGKKGGKKEAKKGSKDKGGKKGKKGASDTKVPAVTFENKQAQTPRLFPWEKIVFSNKAKLGRVAKQVLGQGDVLSDSLLVDMFVEYLSSMSGIKGWVLLNYPNNYDQAALLEQALCGKPVPKQYYDKVLNKQSLESVEVDLEEEEETVDDTETAEEAAIEEASLEVPPIFCNAVPSKPYSDESEISGVQTTSTKKSSAKCSLLSEVTILADWNLTSEDKIARILPDLKDSVYSDEDEEEAEKETVPDAKRACTCVCNPVKPRPTEASDAIETSSRDAGVTVHEEGCDEKPPMADASSCSEKPSQAKSAEVENGESMPQALSEECLCYLVNVQPELEVETKEENVQTDILGLRQDLGDEPLQRPVAEDVYEERRLSKVVPNPCPLEKEEYLTVLTAFIRVLEKKRSDEDDEEYPIPCFEEIEKKDGLEKFYCDQGCYYLLQYEEFTADTVKCLAKMIVGDYSLPLKTSVEIFGEHYKEAMLEDGEHKITKKGKEEKKDKKKKKGKEKRNKSDTKAGKEKKSKSEISKGKKDKKGKKGKKGKTDEKDVQEKVMEHDDKEVQVPTIEEAEDEELPEARAGEPGWEYINLPIPEDIELVLASFWDNFEQNYVQNFKELFYNKRILLNDVVPFLAKIREAMGGIIAREDSKEYYLREFQKTLNQIDLELRSDPKTKEELLCRIDEFQDKLMGICDTKMTESEEERRNFVRQNWLFHQFCEMTNNITKAFQLEIDRLVDTLQFLSDYYTAVIKKSIAEGYDFHKQLLPRHECNDNTSEQFNNLFIDIERENKEETEFHHSIEESKNIALSFVESMKTLATKPIDVMKKLFDSKGKDKKEKKEKKGKGKKFELDEDVKENSDRIFEEWECALNGEFARMSVHLSAIRNEAFHRFNNVITWIKKIFEMIFGDIKERYENEMVSVQKACRLLRESVEKEVIIQSELTFEGDQLAEIQIALFPESLVILEPDYTEGTFKIEHLEGMVRILFDLARDGYIMRKTFMLLIQDILYQDDLEQETDTPKMWRNLSTNTLNALLKKLFDDEKYLYWKDFIVCNLMIPFPTREELMEVRAQFRQFDIDLTERVTRDEFDTVNFWFDDREYRERLRSIIFRMYQTNEDEFNYTAMLLDFCKDKDPVLGFVKALELSLGKFICYDQELGKKFVDESLENRMLFEQQVKEHEETTILAKKAVSLLIDKIVDQVDGPEGFALQELETEVGEAKPLSSFSLKDKSVSRSKSVQSELVEGNIIAEKFSYAKIGFEARDDTQLCYFLPLELVLIIVSTEVSWNSEVEEFSLPCFRERIIEIYEECRNEQFRDVVLAHEFLNNEKLRELFGTTNKFLAHNPVRLVKRILEDSTEAELDLKEFVGDSGDCEESKRVRSQLDGESEHD